MTNIDKTYDNNLLLKDAGLVAASAAAQVLSVNKIIDLSGSGSGIGIANVEGDIIIDVSACEVASEDESYQIEAQISDSATFATGIFGVCAVRLGASESEFLNYVNRKTGYIYTLDTPVAGTAGPTAGYATISNSGTLGAFTGATVPALASRTYNLDIQIDGGTNRKLEVALLVTDTWTQIAAKLQTALRTATSSTETVAISSGKILVTSATTGITSAVLIAIGTAKSTTVINGDTDMGAGRYVLPFKNFSGNNVAKRYLRVYTTVRGTIATGINYTAYLTRKN